MVVKPLTLLLLAFSLLLLGCDQDDPSPIPGASWDIAVLNEGQLGSNNASITTFSDSGGQWQAAQYQFEAANDQPLGDVLNSFTYDSTTGALYLVMDNSKRIYKVDPASWTLQATLDFPNGANPRNLVIAPGGKGYVSSLFNGKVYVLDMNNFSITDEIQLEPYPDHLVLHAGKLLVSCANLDVQRTNNKLAVIDIAADTVSNYISLPRANPATLTAQPNGDLVVECRGTYYTEQHAAWVWLEASTGELTDSLLLDSHTFGTSLYDPTEQMIYFVLGDALDPAQQHIARLDLHTRRLEPQYIAHSQLQLADTEYPYALRMHDGWLYVGISAGTLDGRLIRLRADDTALIEQLGPTGQFPGELIFADDLR
ncbi:MAG: YncE family protein [Bacteroidota bacterium]